MNELEKAAREHMKDADFVQDGYVCGVYAFIAGAKWVQSKNSCCCGGCTKHNIALTTENQNSEFDQELTDEEEKILSETGYLCKTGSNK